MSTTEVLVADEDDTGFTTDAGSIGVRVDAGATAERTLAVGREVVGRAESVLVYLSLAVLLVFVAYGLLSVQAERSLPSSFPGVWRRSPLPAAWCSWPTRASS